MVRPPLVGPYPSPDDRRVTAGGGAGDGGGVHDISVSMATRHAWGAFAWRSRSFGSDSAIGRIRSRRVGVGAASLVSSRGEVRSGLVGPLVSRWVDHVGAIVAAS